MTVGEVNGIVEFYAHAIPFLASTREKRGVVTESGNIISIAFNMLQQGEKTVGKSSWLKENLRLPRGPDH